MLGLIQFILHDNLDALHFPKRKLSRPQSFQNIPPKGVSFGNEATKIRASVQPSRVFMEDHFFCPNVDDFYLYIDSSRTKVTHLS